MDVGILPKPPLWVHQRMKYPVQPGQLTAPHKRMKHPDPKKDTLVDVVDLTDDTEPEPFTW